MGEENQIIGQTLANHDPVEKVMVRRGVLHTVKRPQKIDMFLSDRHTLKPGFDAILYEFLCADGHLFRMGHALDLHFPG